MPRPVRIRVNYDRSDQAAQLIAGALSEAVAEAAFAIQEEAASNAPVDTGSLKNAIYVETSSSDGRSVGVRSAKGLNPDVRFAFRSGAALGPAQARVAVTVEHGVYVEFGTHKMQARPYLRGAVETVKPKFNKIVKRIIKEKGL